MKNIIIILTIIFLTSCGGPQMKKRYTFEVTYTNSNIDTLSYLGVGDNKFILEQGDFKRFNSSRTTLLSGVRSYRVISIQNLGLQNKNEQKGFCSCSYELKLEPKIKNENI